MFLAIPTHVHYGPKDAEAPLANSLLIAVNVLAFFLGVHQPVGAGTSWASVLGYGFSHAGLTHLMVNMWLLWVIGNPVNRRVGNAYYLIGYLGTIVLMGIGAKFLIGNYLVGSSGAIFAVIAVLSMLLPAAKVDVGYVVVFPLTLLIGLLKIPRHWVYWCIRWGTMPLKAWWFLVLVPVLQLLGLFWWSWNWTNLGHLLGFVFSESGLCCYFPKRYQCRTSADSVFNLKRIPDAVRQTHLYKSLLDKSLLIKLEKSYGHL